jgi:hypothetical protein
MWERGGNCLDLDQAAAGATGPRSREVMAWVFRLALRVRAVSRYRFGLAGETGTSGATGAV